MLESLLLVWIGAEWMAKISFKRVFPSCLIKTMVPNGWFWIAKTFLALVCPVLLFNTCSYLTFICSDYIWSIIIIRYPQLSSLLQTCETLKNTIIVVCYMYLNLLTEDNGLDPSIYSPPRIGPITIPVIYREDKRLIPHIT